MILKTILIHSVVLTAILIGCKSEDKSEVIDTPTTGTFELVADEEIRPVIDSLVTGFNTRCQEAKVHVRYTNATAALDELLSDKARLIILGRPLRVSERRALNKQQIELPEYEVALHPISIIVSGSSPIEEIDLDDLRADLTGKKQIYHKVLTSYLSSTEAILDSIFMYDTASIRGAATRVSTVDSITTLIRKQKDYIGFISVSVANRDSNVKQLRIRYIQADGTVRNVMQHPAYVYQRLSHHV